MTTRRRVLAAAALTLGATAWHGAARATGPAQQGLSLARSLAIEIQRAAAQGKALVVMVSLDGCPICQLARQSYLAPLRAAGQPTVQLDMGSALEVSDAQGRSSTHAAIIRAFGVRLAPTVLFLGRGGVEVAPRLAGMSIPDFYGAYLQDRVDTANRSIAS